MHLDVVDLRKFYYRTQLGRIAQRVLRSKLEELWGNTTGQTVAGFGFAAPMLRPFLKTARRVLCLMPGQQGVMAWPEGQTNRSLLVHETLWPISTGHIDRLVVLHGLETCDNQSALLDEIWRVMGPGGRVVFVVPNRSGLWARGDGTPFGYGRPYSVAQLDTQLIAHNFVPENHILALYAAPNNRPFWLKTAAIWESIATRLHIPLAAGVILVEATKRIHAPANPGKTERVREKLGALKGIGRPVVEPVPGHNGNISTSLQIDPSSID
jgi:SAM-dependent methyltransferase